MTYAEVIRESLDWKSYSKLVHAIGNQFNDRKNRFDKSDILEKAFDVYSNGRFTHIDETGRDHLDIETGYFIEFKYSEDSLFNKRGVAKSTINVWVKNTLSITDPSEIKNPADFYILAQQNAMAVLSWDDLVPELYSDGRGAIRAKVPVEKISYVFTPCDVIDVVLNESTINYAQEKHEMQMKIIRSVL